MGRTEIRESGRERNNRAKKGRKGPEEHGLFRIQWDNRVSWKFTYFPDENILRMLSAEGVRMEKALLFGKWKPVERYDNIPADILRKALQRPASGAVSGASFGLSHGGNG